MGRVSLPGDAQADRAREAQGSRAGPVARAVRAHPCILGVPTQFALFLWPATRRDSTPMPRDSCFAVSAITRSSRMFHTQVSVVCGNIVLNALDRRHRYKQQLEEAERSRQLAASPHPSPSVCCALAGPDLRRCAAPRRISSASTLRKRSARHRLMRLLSSEAVAMSRYLQTRPLSTTQPLSP